MRKYLKGAMGVIIVAIIWVGGMYWAVNHFPDGMGRDISCTVLTLVAGGLLGYGNAGPDDNTPDSNSTVRL